MSMIVDKEKKIMILIDVYKILIGKTVDHNLNVMLGIDLVA